MSAELPPEIPETQPPKGFALKHLTLLPSLPDNVYLLPKKEDIPDDVA